MAGPGAGGGRGLRSLLAARAAVFFGGEGYLRRTTGPTYAEYVHHGFAQLTVPTALTLLVVALVAAEASRERHLDRVWLRVSLGLLCAQTLAVVASALHRMHLYQEAYGFSRLRRLVDVFEGWLGLVVLGVLACGVTLRGALVPRAALLSGAASLLVLALLDPDAWIARRNLGRYAETGKVDAFYLQGLSDDAVPALADVLPRSPPAPWRAAPRPRTAGWSGTSAAPAPPRRWLPGAQSGSRRIRGLARALSRSVSGSW